MRSLSHAALLAVLVVGAAARADEPSGTDEPAPEADPAIEASAPLARPYLVERIVIAGGGRTRESEVRRHLLVKEGDVLDEEKVLLSRLRLGQLGWFSRVETHVERGSERGRVVLFFTVTERNTLVISDLAFGSTGPQPIYAGFGLTEQNFLGRGMAVSGAFVYGGSPVDRPADPARFAFRASLYDPELPVKGLPPLILGLTFLGLRGEEITCNTSDCAELDGHFGGAPRIRYSRVGGELIVGVRGPFERFMAGYRGEWLRSESLGGSVPSGPAPFLRDGHSFLSALTGTYDRDTRNDIFLPTEGSRVTGQIVFSSRALGSDYDYSRYLLQVERSFPLGGNALRLQTALGAVQGDAPFFDRFYPADFAYFTVGPALGRALELNFSPDSRYDALLAMAGAEYGIPLWSSGSFFHRGYLALGARWLWTAARAGVGRTHASKLPVSGDVALRFDTPVGMFNASVGYFLDDFL
jgi:outer membrane protein assembly factor BamA